MHDAKNLDFIHESGDRSFVVATAVEKKSSFIFIVLSASFQGRND